MAVKFNPSGRLILYLKGYKNKTFSYKKGHFSRKKGRKNIKNSNWAMGFNVGKRRGKEG